MYGSEQNTGAACVTVRHFSIASPAMIAFLDTEFTDLVTDARLLSVGLVAGHVGGPQFYAEVTDRDRLRAAGWFALDAVLPQFGLVPLAACTYLELGARLAAFLDSLVATLAPRECVELVYGYHLDWDLIEQAIQDSGAPHWASTRARVQPVNVYDITGFGAGKLAALAYYSSQAGAPYSRHHALCDARALRLAYAAALQSTARPSPNAEAEALNA